MLHGFFYLYNLPMKTFLDKFILGFPRLYIKQFPYAWIIFIALWTWPLNIISVIFLLIILLGMLLLHWQYTAWMRKLRNIYAPGDGKFYIDRPALPLERAARNIAILLAVSGLITFFLQGQFGLAPWQFFLIMVGFSLMYRDRIFFGSPTTYVIAASGIGIYLAAGHLDYRMFLNFNEIARIERYKYQKDQGWFVLARTPDSKDGLLLIPKSPNGFSKHVMNLFIVPKDIEKFLEQLPYGFKPLL